MRPPSDNISCIQQYEWNKCGAPFLQNYCDRACGRCASAERREFFRRTVLVSARQHAPCASAAGDFWVGRAQQNKAEYARAHGMQLVLASSLFDGEYEGAWNKLVTLHRVLAAELNASKALTLNLFALPDLECQVKKSLTRTFAKEKEAKEKKM